MVSRVPEKFGNFPAGYRNNYRRFQKVPEGPTLGATNLEGPTWTKGRYRSPHGLAAPNPKGPCGPIYEKGPKTLGAALGGNFPLGRPPLGLGGGARAAPHAYIRRRGGLGRTPWNPSRRPPSPTSLLSPAAAWRSPTGISPPYSPPQPSWCRDLSSHSLLAYGIKKAESTSGISRTFKSTTK